MKGKGSRGSVTRRVAGGKRGNPTDGACKLRAWRGINSAFAQIDLR